MKAPVKEPPQPCGKLLELFFAPGKSLTGAITLETNCLLKAVNNDHINDADDN